MKYMHYFSAKQRSSSADHAMAMHFLNFTFAGPLRKNRKGHLRCMHQTRSSMQQRL